jgi:hypothetical protein
MVGHSPTNMHMGAYVITTNVAQHKSTPRINLTWDQKVLGPYLPMKDLGMAIQK